MTVPVAGRDVDAGSVRRRPTGEPPPLPRPFSVTSRLFVLAGTVLAGFWIALSADPVLRVVTRVDLAVLDLCDRVRSGPLSDAAAVAAAAGSPWVFRPLLWSTLIVLAAFRRFQHLLALVAVTVVVIWAGTTVSAAVARMRPVAAPEAGSWVGFSHPSLPLVTLSVACVGALYTLAPAGRTRFRAAAVALPVLAAVGLGRVYLGLDHASDVAAALVLGGALPAVAFRLLTPEEAFPVEFRGGGRAHLDVGGARGRAIVEAMRTQLGLDVVACEPFALHGSAGSTPLRLRVKGPEGEERVVFGKLYALTHLRSDRWYKLARSVLYGRLEDERPFNTVRRLVQYEDYMLHLINDAGVPTARPLGLVEITPEREYLLVTEFLDGTARILDADIDDDVVDAALAVVRSLWDAGLAHRDIKPANLLVRGGEVLLIDVAFGEARPTPWRQAVDLANMMLTLALRVPPERVYERALRQFDEAEVAEAFAASRGVTIPSELRSRLRADGRDLLSRFRDLAPPRRPVRIQRWTVRRVALTVAVVLAVAAVAGLALGNLRAVGLL